MSKYTAEQTSLAELAAYLDAHRATTHLDAITFDLCGIARGKRYPRAEVEKLFTGGFQFPYSVFLLDVTGSNSDAGGRGFSDGDPDGLCLPVPGTLMPTPWAGEGAAQVLVGMVEPDGSPAMVEPRNIAAAAVARFAELDLTPVVAFELEFALLDPAHAGRGAPLPPVSPLTGLRDDGTQVYGMDEVGGFADLFAEVAGAGARQGLPISVATAEYGPGQYEINLHHVDSALAAADHCALLRHLVKGVARRHGVRATFMSKPSLDRTGNGMHVHMSLLDAEGRNVFADEAAAGSERLRHAIGGLLDTMPDAMALFAPNINAYRRFAPRLYVPVTRSWGVNNRSVAVRVPAGPPQSRRFEHRVAGADANPYLVLAALLAGVHRGLTEGIEPGPPARGSACDTMDDTIPFSLERALARLEASSSVAPWLGEGYARLYCETKRAELARFMNFISPREYEWYL